VTLTTGSSVATVTNSESKKQKTKSFDSRTSFPLPTSASTGQHFSLTTILSEAEAQRSALGFFAKSLTLEESLPIGANASGCGPLHFIGGTSAGVQSLQDLSFGVIVDPSVQPDTDGVSVAQQIVDVDFVSLFATLQPRPMMAKMTTEDVAILVKETVSLIARDSLTSISTITLSQKLTARGSPTMAILVESIRGGAQWVRLWLGSPLAIAGHAGISVYLRLRDSTGNCERLLRTLILGILETMVSGKLGPEISGPGVSNIRTLQAQLQAYIVVSSTRPTAKSSSMSVPFGPLLILAVVSGALKFGLASSVALETYGQKARFGYSFSAGFETMHCCNSDGASGVGSGLVKFEASAIAAAAKQFAITAMQQDSSMALLNTFKDLCIHQFGSQVSLQSFLGLGLQVEGAKKIARDGTDHWHWVHFCRLNTADSTPNVVPSHTAEESDSEGSCSDTEFESTTSDNSDSSSLDPCAAERPDRASVNNAAKPAGQTVVFPVLGLPESLCPFTLTLTRNRTPVTTHSTAGKTHSPLEGNISTVRLQSYNNNARAVSAGLKAMNVVERLEALCLKPKKGVGPSHKDQVNLEKIETCAEEYAGVAQEFNSTFRKSGCSARLEMTVDSMHLFSGDVQGVHGQSALQSQREQFFDSAISALLQKGTSMIRIWDATPILRHVELIWGTHLKILKSCPEILRKETDEEELKCVRLTMASSAAILAALFSGRFRKFSGLHMLWPKLALKVGRPFSILGNLPPSVVLALKLDHGVNSSAGVLQLVPERSALPRMAGQAATTVSGTPRPNNALSLRKSELQAVGGNLFRCASCSEYFAGQQHLHSHLLKFPEHKLGGQRLIASAGELSFFWTNAKLGLGSEQLQAFQLVVENGKNIIIVGAAGVGKSHLTRCILYVLRCVFPDPTDVLVTSTTGITASLIDSEATTLHSALKLPTTAVINFATVMKDWQKIPEFIARMQSVRVLFVDEIGMARGSLLTLMDQLLRKVRDIDSPFGGVQMILGGDPLQLEAIQGGGQTAPDQFHDSSSLVDFSVVELRKVYRQDAQAGGFLKALHGIREGVPNSVAHFKEVALREQFGGDVKLALAGPTSWKQVTHIYAKRDCCEAMNKNCLVRLCQGSSAKIINLLAQPTAVKSSANLLHSAVEMDESGYVKLRLPNVLQVAVGSRLMTLVNRKKEGYMNGTIVLLLEVVRHPTGDIASLRVADQTIPPNVLLIERVLAEVTVESKIITALQFPVSLSYALTVNKTQGLQEKLLVVHADGMGYPGQLYTALSRCPSGAGLLVHWPAGDALNKNLASQRGLLWLKQKADGGKPKLSSKRPATTLCSELNPVIEGRVVDYVGSVIVLRKTMAGAVATFSATKTGVHTALGESVGRTQSLPGVACRRAEHLAEAARSVTTAGVGPVPRLQAVEPDVPDEDLDLASVMREFWHEETSSPAQHGGRPRRLFPPAEISKTKRPALCQDQGAGQDHRQVPKSASCLIPASLPSPWSFGIGGPQKNLKIRASHTGPFAAPAGSLGNRDSASLRAQPRVAAYGLAKQAIRERR
jgi:ATP-dependent DNA helicase PIF1